MAKIPKFNLILDGELVRTIEQLQENFSVDDILEHFDSKRLQKWLASRGFADYQSKVEAIQSADKCDIIKELMDIFDIEYSQDDLADIRAQLNYTPRKSADYPIVPLEGKQGDNTNYPVATSNSSGSVNLDYELQKYNDLVNEIINNPEDLDLVTKNIETIASKYYSFLSLDAVYLLHKVSQESPLPMYAILDNPKAFKAYLPLFIMNSYNYRMNRDSYSMNRNTLSSIQSIFNDLSKSAWNVGNIAENSKLFPHITKVLDVQYFKSTLNIPSDIFQSFNNSMEIALNADNIAENYKLFPHIKKLQNVRSFKLDNPVLVLYNENYTNDHNNSFRSSFNENELYKSLDCITKYESEALLYYVDLDEYDIPSDLIKEWFNDK